MPFRNDQLVGCLTDMQNLEEDLEDLINDQNQHQYNQYIVDSGQMLGDHSTTLNPSPQSGGSSNQFETVQSTFNQPNNPPTGYLLGPTTASDRRAAATNFDFDTTDFTKQLDYAGQSANLDAFDDELELHHLKELEDLMEINQPARIDNLGGPVGHQLNGPTNGPVSRCSSIGSELSGNRAGANLPSSLSVSIHNLPSNLQPAQTPQPQQQQFLLHANQQPSRANSHPTAFENNRSSFSANASAKLAAATRLLPSSIQANSSVRNDNSFLSSLNSSLNNSLNSSASQVNSTCSNFLKQTGASFGNSASAANYPQLTSNSSNELAAYCDPLLGNSLNSNSLNSNSLNSNLNSNRTANSLPSNLQPSSSDLRAPPPSDSSASYSASQPPNHLQTISSKLQSGPDQPGFCSSDFDMPTTSTMLKSDLSNCFVGQGGQLAVGQLCNTGQMMMTGFNSVAASLQQQQAQPAASLPAMSRAAQSPVMQHLPQFKASSSTSSSSSARSPSNEWFDTVVGRLLSDMQRCGICVIDNFLGSSFCDTILSEVVDMYSEGCFKDGLLVGSQSSAENIRGDKIHWVEGKEPNCLNIGYLMRTLDQILMRFSRLNVDGRQILNRTKAMIACYPANGTKYVKHVDNPSQDGRYITCIYYLNKSWQSQRDGGTLRIFPKNLPYVANIEPLFDRVIFFWSDRRNPHEVMPAYSIRFAITLWYFNSQEREQYIKKMQSLQS